MAVSDILDLTPQSSTTLILIGTAVICYQLHHYVGIPFFRRLLEARAVDENTREIRAVLLQRLTGVIFLGLIPAGVAALFVGGSPADYGLTLNRPWLSLGLGIAGGLSVIVPSLLYLKTSPGLLSYYPEMRVRYWPFSLAVLNTVSWIVYLAAYELLFRGILVCRLVPTLGFWPAIFVSSALYAFAHLPKHPTESSTIFPGGIMLGWTAAYTGSLLGPYLAHAMLAAGSELIAVHASPDRSFGRAPGARGSAARN